MTVIHLPDQQVAALKAKAEAQGLTLKAWLEHLATDEGRSPLPRTSQEAVAHILELQTRVKSDPEGWNVHDYIHLDRP